MTAALQSASIKSLALRVLQEMASRRELQGVSPAPVAHVGHGEGQDTGARGEGLSPCGSAHCEGCYDVGDGRKIHPPKIGEDYRKWLEPWKPRGMAQ